MVLSFRGGEGKENLRAEVIDILDDIGGRGPKYVACAGYYGRRHERNTRPGKAIMEGRASRAEYSPGQAFPRLLPARENPFIRVKRRGPDRELWFSSSGR